MDDRSLEELETLKSWWDKNGKITISTILIVIILFVSFMFYKQNQEKRILEASDLSYSLIVEKNDREKFLDKLIQKYSDLTITQLTLLDESKKTSSKSDLDKTYSILKAISQNTKDPFIKDLAILREVKILIQQNKLSEAKNILQKISVKELLASKFEFLGDISQLESNKEDALQYYQKAVKNMSVPKTSLILKFNDLGGLNEFDI